MMPTARQLHSLAAVNSSHIVLFGGVDQSGTVLNDLWIFSVGTFHFEMQKFLYF
jgi:hypothetical protein